MSSPAHELKDRPDVDGLRAIAVVAVLLYHVGMAAVPGGFVGVDMFFVISGFLITKIIYDRHVQGRFIYGEFYRRRALRILPALGAVLVFVLLVGWRVLPPSDDLGTSGSNSVVASRSLAATVDELLRDRHAVLLIGPVPGEPADAPLARSTHASPRQRSWFRQVNAALFASLDRISSRRGATVVDVLPWSCGQERCDYVFQARSRYRDGHHLSVAGALAFSNRIEDAFSGALASSVHGAK